MLRRWIKYSISNSFDVRSRSFIGVAHHACACREKGSSHVLYVYTDRHTARTVFVRELFNVRIRVLYVARWDFVFEVSKP